jgi:hypothetical protein
MQRIGDLLVYSPSDLNHFLECEHLTYLSSARQLFASAGPRCACGAARTAKAWSTNVRGSNDCERRVAPSSRFAATETRDWESDARKTLAAMKEGADVI